MVMRKLHSLLFILGAVWLLAGWKNLAFAEGITAPGGAVRAYNWNKGESTVREVNAKGGILFYRYGNCYSMVLDWGASEGEEALSVSSDAFSCRVGSDYDEMLRKVVAVYVYNSKNAKTNQDDKLRIPIDYCTLISIAKEDNNELDYEKVNLPAMNFKCVLDLSGIVIRDERQSDLLTEKLNTMRGLQTFFLPAGDGIAFTMPAGTWYKAAAITSEANSCTSVELHPDGSGLARRKAGGSSYNPAFEYVMVTGKDASGMALTLSGAFDPTRTNIYLHETWKGYQMAGFYESLIGQDCLVGTDVKGTGKSKGIYLAKWDPVEYLVTYKNEDDRVKCDLPDPQTFTVETETFELPGLPGDRHYRFQEWNTKRDGTGEAVGKIEKGTADPQTLYAIWTPVLYGLSYHSNYPEGDASSVVWYAIEETTEGDSGVRAFGGTAEDRVILLENISELKSFTRPYYEFAGWSVDRNGGEPVTELSLDRWEELTKGNAEQNPDSTAFPEVYAQWSPKVYMPEYVSGESAATFDSSVSEDMRQFTVETGCEKKLPQPVREGYDFAGWLDSADRLAVSFPYPVYQAGQASLDEADFAAGNPERIDHWEYRVGTSGGAEFETIELDGNDLSHFVLYAKWIPAEYSITYDARGDRSWMRVRSAGSAEEFLDRSAGYTVEEEVKLPVLESDGYVFQGWRLADTDGMELVSGLEKGSTGDKSFVGVWEPVTYTIQYDLAGGSMNRITRFTADDVIAIPDPVFEGKHFDGWSVHFIPDHGDEDDLEGYHTDYVISHLAMHVRLTAHWSSVSSAPVEDGTTGNSQEVADSVTEQAATEDSSGEQAMAEDPAEEKTVTTEPAEEQAATEVCPQGEASASESDKTEETTVASTELITGSGESGTEKGVVTEETTEQEMDCPEEAASAEKSSTVEVPGSEEKLLTGERTTQMEIGSGGADAAAKWPTQTDTESGGAEFTEKRTTQEESISPGSNESVTSAPEKGDVAKEKKILSIPEKVAGLKLKAGRGKCVITWKRCSGCTYKIQYSRSRSMKSAKTINCRINRKTIKKLKSNRKYFIRVRAVKIVNGKKVTGKWSAMKCFKTK